MTLKSFPSSASPRLEINADGNLKITGWVSELVEAQIQDESDLTVELVENGLNIYAEDDCELSVPQTATLQINLVEGSLSISTVLGEISIQSVGGHLTLQATGPVTCGNVSGHLKFSETVGALRIRNVGGNLKGNQAAGALTVANVGGNIKMLDVMLVDKVHAGGNIKVKYPASPQELEALAGGNIKLWVPEEANFALEAYSGGEKVVFQSGSESQRIGSSRHRMTMGAGGPLVRLHAGGNVYILTSGWEDDLSSEDFVTSDDFTMGWFRPGMNENFQKRIDAKVREAEARATEATRKAEQRIGAAMRKAEKASDKFGEKFWSGSRGWPAPQPGHPAAPEVPGSRVSDEERMLILTMLSEKKISAEEANQLLDALNGKFGK